MIRENIMKYFKERACVTLPRPTESEDDLKNLKRLPFERLKPNFKLEFMALRNKVYKESQPKTINNKKLTGTALASLIVEFINAINNGAVPNINNSWDNVIQSEISGYYDKALINYKSQIRKLNKDAQDEVELLKTLYDIKNDSVNIYNKFLTINTDVINNKEYMKWYEEKYETLILQIETIEADIISKNNDKTKK
jgi:hypothetical protein